MKKLTRKSLEELAKTLPVIEESFQMSYVGGGDGTSASPYTQAEFDSIADSGTWSGGYVEGWGYVGGEVICTPGGNYTDRGAYAASIAGSYIGVSETNNPDQVVDFFNSTSYDGATSSTPWCAAFVSSVYDDAGISNPNSAAVDGWRNWGNSTSNPAVGDIAIWNTGSHIGIVTSVDGDNVTITHGNWSDQVESSVMPKSSFTFRTR